MTINEEVKELIHNKFSEIDDKLVDIINDIGNFDLTKRKEIMNRLEEIRKWVY